MALSAGWSQDGHQNQNRILRPLPGIDVKRVRTGTTLRIVVSGEIDIVTAPELHAQIAQSPAGDAELVVLDLERVTFIDSTGLYALLAAHEHLDGRLRIATSGPVTRLLDVAGIRDRLPVIDS